MLSTRAIMLGGVVLVLVAIGSALGLFLLLGGGTSREAARLDAIRTASSLVIGTGGAAALLLAARRQRSTELDLVQKDHDATERRVTELYGKAADQLGSDKAPVRLAGLYALERLAQANPEHRQTIVNVICAYLRMPFEPPQRFRRDFGTRTGTGGLVIAQGGVGASSVSAPDLAQPTSDEREVQEEIQVRLAAQGILTSHLRPYGFLSYAEPVGDVDSDLPTAERFWDGMHLDLVGAYLLDFGFTQCSVSSANFTYAVLDGETGFNGARFAGLILFHGATFRTDAWFRGATFEIGAGFGATFRRGAHFEKATFGEESGLGGTYLGEASFDGARLVDPNFRGASFAKEASFDDATFEGTISFSGAELHGTTSLNGARAENPEADHELPQGWAVVIDEQGDGQLVRSAAAELR